MSSRSALLRLAGRDARHNPRRTLLMLLLVALPIAAVSLATTLFATLRVTGDDRATSAMGNADLVLHAKDGTRISELLPATRALLGPGATIEPVAQRPRSLAHGGVRTEGVLWASQDHTATQAALELVDGRWPGRPGELLLSPAVVGDLDVGLGDVVEVSGRRHRLVGIARDRLDLDRGIGATTLGGEPPTALFVALPGDRYRDRDLGLAETARLDALGWVPSLRSTVAGSSGEAAVGIVLLGGVAFVVVGMVASAAFAVVAEHRRRDLSLLRALGASPRQLRQAVTTSGWVVGALGAVAGSLVGVAVPVMARGLLESFGDRAVTDVRVPWPAVVALAVVGTVTTVMAARAPARHAAAGTTSEALAGPVRDRPWERLPAARVVVGLGGLVGLAALGLLGAGHLSLVTGAGLALVLVTMAVVGSGGAGPWLTNAVSRVVTPRAGPAVRIGLRDLVRMPSRTGPIVTALVSVLVLDLLVVGFVEAVAGPNADRPARLDPDHLIVDGVTPAAALADLRSHLPVTGSAQLRILQPVARDPASSPGSGRLPWIAVASRDLLDVLGLDQAQDALAAGRTLVLDERDDTAAAPGVPAALAPNGVHEIDIGARPRDVPPVLVGPDALTSAGLMPARDINRLLVRLDRPVTEADLATASEVASVHGVHVQGAHPPPTIDVGRVRTLATTGSGIVALLVAVTGLALLTAEGRRTDRALLELGAPPRLHRHLAGTRALLLCGLAGAIALVISTLALSAVSRADPTSSIADVVDLPASGAVLTLVVVPLAAAAIAWAPHRRRPWQHPRR